MPYVTARTGSEDTDKSILCLSCNKTCEFRREGEQAIIQKTYGLF